MGIFAGDLVSVSTDELINLSTSS